MFNFLSSIRHDYVCCQIESVEKRINDIEAYIKECDESIYNLRREKDHYEEVLIKEMEKRLDLIEIMDAAPTTSTIKQTHKLA